MPAIHLPATQHLAPGMLMSVIPEHLLYLHIQRGLVWVTVEGDEMDYWLRAGELLPLPVSRHVVIEADGGEACEFSMLTTSPHHAAAIAAIEQRVLTASAAA